VVFPLFRARCFNRSLVVHSFCNCASRFSAFFARLFCYFSTFSHIFLSGLSFFDIDISRRFLSFGKSRPVDQCNRVIGNELAALYRYKNELATFLLTIHLKNQRRLFENKLLCSPLNKYFYCICPSLKMQPCVIKNTIFICQSIKVFTQFYFSKNALFSKTIRINIVW